MSKTPTKAPTPPRAKPQLGAGVLGQLRAASGETSQGEPIRIALGNIDVDPNQPRKVFDQDELESLAESIKARGVLQAIVVRPAVKGRHILVMGERRFRASKLAGVADIPAIVRKTEDDDFAAQVIENQQRANLSTSELSAAVLRFVDEGRTTKEIGNICNLKEHQVAAYRKSGEFPAELRDRMDTADIRALYDLFRQWSKTPAEVIAALPAIGEPLTITEARRIVSGITGKASGSIILDRAQGEAPAAPAPAGEALTSEASQEPELFGDAPKVETPAPAPAAPAPAQAPAPAKPADDEPKAEAPAIEPSAPAPATAPVEPEQSLHGARVADEPQRSSTPVFMVRTSDGTQGRLIVDRRAEQDGWALVELDGAIEEIDPAELTFDRIE